MLFCRSFLLFMFHVCLYCTVLSSGHLLGKELTSWLSYVWCFYSFCHFPIWCLGASMVLDSINSWSVPPSLLIKLYRLSLLGEIFLQIIKRSHSSCCYAACNWYMYIDIVVFICYHFLVFDEYWVLVENKYVSDRWSETCWTIHLLSKKRLFESSFFKFCNFSFACNDPCIQSCFGWIEFRWIH